MHRHPCLSVESNLTSSKFDDSSLKVATLAANKERVNPKVRRVPYEKVKRFPFYNIKVKKVTLYVEVKGVPYRG